MQARGRARPPARRRFAKALRLWMIDRDGRTPEEIRSKVGRTKMVSALDGRSRFRCRCEVFEAGILYRDAATKYHWRAYAWPRPQRYHPRYSRTPCPYAGLRSALVARDGSCRHRDANSSRKVAAQKRRSNASGFRTRGISTPCDGMAG